MRARWLLALSLLVACAPLEQAFHPAPPGKPRLVADHFETADGVHLPYQGWLPSGKPKAIILALHGFNDYSNAFAGPGRFLAARGIALYAYDQRGFGASPEPGVWGGQGNLARDAAQFAEVLSERHPRAPLYLLGESMGGAVAIVAAAKEDFPKVAGIILSAPAVWGEDEFSPLYRAMLWAFAHTMPFAEFTGGDLKILASDNIPMLRALSADPLVIKSTRADAIYGLVALMDEAYATVPKLRAPVLLLYGACDQVIPPQPVAAAAANFSGNLTAAYYPEGYHMLLRDLQSPRVMDDIVSWMKSPTRPLPSGEAMPWEKGGPLLAPGARCKKLA